MPQGSTTILICMATMTIRYFSINISVQNKGQGQYAVLMNTYPAHGESFSLM